MLERERSRLVVRLVATAVELLLLRRRVGAWRWRIFSLATSLALDVAASSLTQDCERLRWQVALPRTSSSSSIATVAVVLPSPPSPLGRCAALADALALFKSREQSHNRTYAAEPSRSQAAASRRRVAAGPQSSRSRAVKHVVAVT